MCFRRRFRKHVIVDRRRTRRYVITRKKKKMRDVEKQNNDSGE
jgi:hypothetical protein